MCSSTRSTPGGGSAAAAMVAVMVAAQGPQVPNGWLSCSHRGNGADAAAPSIVTMALLPLASISWSAASSTPHQSGTNGRQQEAGAQLLFTLAAQQWQPNERQHQGSSPGHSWNPIAVLARCVLTLRAMSAATTRHRGERDGVPSRQRSADALRRTSSRANLGHSQVQGAGGFRGHRRRRRRRAAWPRWRRARGGRPGRSGAGARWASWHCPGPWFGDRGPQ